MSNRIHSFYGRKPVYRPSRSRIYVNHLKIYAKPLGLMIYRINKGDGEFCLITFMYTLPRIAKIDTIYSSSPNGRPSILTITIEVWFTVH